MNVSVIWISLLPGILPLTYYYYEHASGEVAAQITQMNSKKGFDQSIPVSDIMSDFFTPFKSAHLKQYARNNAIDAQSYYALLRESLPSPVLIGLKFHIFVLFAWIAGLPIQIIWGTPQHYLIAIFLLFFIDVFIYILLRYHL